MVKVLIYSSKEVYDKASYEGRAEADIIAYGAVDRYGDPDNYQVVKDRTGKIGTRFLYGKKSMQTYIDWAERDEWERELNASRL